MAHRDENSSIWYFFTSNAYAATVVEAAFDLGADLDEDEIKNVLSQIRSAKRHAVVHTAMLPLFLIFDLLLRGRRGVSIRLRTQKDIFKLLSTSNNTLSRRHFDLYMRK